MEKLVIAFTFIAFILWLIASDGNRKVSVHICESDGVSTYASREPPPDELKFGECHVEVMENSRYYHLRQVMKRGAK